MLSNTALASGVTILTPDNLHDEVNPLFSVVAEVGIDEPLVDLEGIVSLYISSELKSSFISVSCGTVETPEASPVITLHNDKRVKGWVCSTDSCKLVISTEVDLTEWALISGDALTAELIVEIDGAEFGRDSERFTVR
jgi:hypothetical protein